MQTCYSIFDVMQSPFWRSFTYRSWMLLEKISFICSWKYK